MIESMLPGTLTAIIEALASMQRRELSSGLVYTWRKQARPGLLGRRT